ncbi:phage minor head protein [Gilliamella sp. Fer4-1]|uniref:phage minor head protein n=1 Tax=Gilliamella sp. Fer4-1 TaxID=3120242 RepID=UPI00159EC422|nr:phage minor head protein [Gilliamella apicola]
MKRPKIIKPIPKNPLLPKSKNNPTLTNKQILQMRSEIQKRYKTIKQSIIEHIELSLGYYAKEPIKTAIFVDNTLYVVNASVNYTIDGNQLARVLTRIQEIVDENLIDGGIEKFWAGKFVADMYQMGTNRTFHNLSTQSPLYSQATSLESLLFSDAYIRRIGLAYTATFNDWKGLADNLKSDLGTVLSSAVARGINPRETADIISKRIDVSYSRAKTIAQTEQVGALRQATWDETKRTQEELGLKTGLLHMSALKPNSRSTHVDRHGKVYTVEQVADWYEENGNRFNCYCAQVTVLLNEKGEPYNQASIDRLLKESDDWREQNRSKQQSLNSVEDANEWARKHITETSNLPQDIDTKELAPCLKLVSEIQERFNLPKFRYAGTITGDIYKYPESPKEMLAAYSHKANALLITSDSVDKKALLEEDLKSKANGYKRSSINMIGQTNNEELAKIIHEMDYIPWIAVSTPRGVYAHEMGHALHYQHQEEIDNIIKKLWGRGWAHAISKYAQRNKREFVAEAFSLYIENRIEAKKRLHAELFKFFQSLDKGIK